MDHSQGWWDSSKRFSSEAFRVISLNGQRGTNVKIKGKPWQILIDSRATLPTLNLLVPEPTDGLLGKLAEASQG